MLKIALSLILLAAAPLTAVNNQNNKMENTMHKLIQVDTLKGWYDQNKAMTVLDARTKPYFDGTLLPSAKWLPADASEKEILAAVPSKSSLVVVYCYGVVCPASGRLYDKMTAMGYNNIYEYHEGLKDWMERGYPTVKQ